MTERRVTLFSVEIASANGKEGRWHLTVWISRRWALAIGAGLVAAAGIVVTP